MKQRASNFVGRRVKSHFRAPWTGIVVGISDTTDNCVYVRADTDRCGRPMRKPIMMHLNIHWLEKLE